VGDDAARGALVHGPYEVVVGLEDGESVPAKGLDDLALGLDDVLASPELSGPRTARCSPSPWNAPDGTPMLPPCCADTLPADERPIHDPVPVVTRYASPDLIESIACDGHNPADDPR
jgi:hypothetical protein